MKYAAIACNVILFFFTCLVLLTDGPPQGGAYLILALLALLVPLFSSFVLLRSAGNIILRITAMIGNIALLGFSLWAIVSQWPHPEEEGVVAYMVLIVLAPLLSMAALFRAGRAPISRMKQP